MSGTDEPLVLSDAPLASADAPEAEACLAAYDSDEEETETHEKVEL